MDKLLYSNKKSTSPVTRKPDPFETNHSSTLIINGYQITKEEYLLNPSKFNNKPIKKSYKKKVMKEHDIKE